MEKVSVKFADKNRNLIEVKMIITKGKLLALVNALGAYPSPVGQDLRDMIKSVTSNILD